MPPQYTPPAFPSRSSSLTDRADQAGGIAEAVWNNQSLQNAIQLLSSLSDIGRTIPFIAPAFVLLSLIISVERKARDVDLKCNDLLDRITFMLGHLDILRRIQVMDVTKRVIERMNMVLQDSASLIQAYRKQSRIARRLNFSNLEKFSYCADAVATCTKDLMLSLQIQQTGQLDILTRSIPIDPEDRVAQIFVHNHGGLNAVKKDPVLVAEFAKELHLRIDENSMEQINTSLSDLMEQNHGRLETMLKDNISTAIVYGIKELAAQTTDSEKEQLFNCVQCVQQFRESANGSKSCNYHRACYSSWDKRYPCCGNNHPCQVGSHRSKHHCDYPYGSFFEYASKINDYTDTVDMWLELADKNLITDEVRQASVGKLLRWATRSALVQEPTILITVGRPWFSNRYYFAAFTAEDLEAASSFVRVTGNGMIFRDGMDSDAYAMAEWVLNPDGAISGVRLSVKTATSEVPFVSVCPLNITDCSKSGDVTQISKGGFPSYTPSGSYSLPDPKKVSIELSHKPVRETRTDFKTRTTAALPVLMKVTSEPPLKPNANYTEGYSADNFAGVVSIFNKAAVSSTEPISIASIKAYYRLVGEASYKAVKSFKLTQDERLPVTIAPRQTWSMSFEIVVPRTAEDVELEQRWFNRAFVARNRPLRVKLVLEDIEGECCSLVIEHVFDPLFAFEKRATDDIAFHYFDDPERWLRCYVHVTKTSGLNEVIKFNDTVLDVHRLQKTVFTAIQNGETEIDLQIGREKDDGAWEWAVWALIDTSCRRVYGFKILIQQGKRVTTKTMAVLSYISCPLYGDVADVIRELSYAKEKVRFPDLMPLPVQDSIIDDTLDDWIPDSRISPGDVGRIQNGITGDLNSQLASIDRNLSRLADAVEKLVVHLTSK